jgi:hypothetical protein
LEALYWPLRETKDHIHETLQTGEGRVQSPLEDYIRRVTREINSKDYRELNNAVNRKALYDVCKAAQNDNCNSVWDGFENSVTPVSVAEMVVQVYGSEKALCDKKTCKLVNTSCINRYCGKCTVKHNNDFWRVHQNHQDGCEVTKKIKSVFPGIVFMGPLSDSGPFATLDTVGALHVDLPE